MKKTIETIVLGASVAFVLMIGIPIYCIVKIIADIYERREE